MNEPSELQIEKLVSQILKSQEFHDSKRYQELLQFLVTKSMNSSSLKETEIALEFFAKDINFNPNSDPFIRSYISNLRKKLEHYYLTTTDQYDFILEIPKGQYLVKYRPVSSQTPAKSKFKGASPLYISIISVLVLIVIILSIYIWSILSGNSSTATSGSPVWSGYFKKDSYPTLIVLGDYHVLSEKGRKVGRTFLRIPRINSEQELNELSKAEPQKFGNLEISDVTYLGASTALSVTHLVKAIAGTSQKISVKLSSELKWDDFENNNIIFIGTFKALYKLDTLFSRTNIRCNLHPNSINIIDRAKDTTISYDLFWYAGNYQKDFSVILKLKASKNNYIMFLTGFSEVGVMESVLSVTDPGFISKIASFAPKTNFQEPFLFEMLSEVEGVKYTVFHSKIKYFSILQNTAQ